MPGEVRFWVSLMSTNVYIYLEAYDGPYRDDFYSIILLFFKCFFNVFLRLVSNSCTFLFLLLVIVVLFLK